MTLLGFLNTFLMEKATIFHLAFILTTSI